MRYSVTYLEAPFPEIVMALFGILLAILSGVCNGLFTAPMKLEARWRWENTWFVFIVFACLVMPGCFTVGSVSTWPKVFASAPAKAVDAALVFGFAWGFGAICFGRSVERLGVSLANSLVIGLSSALGSLVPLLLTRAWRIGAREKHPARGDCRVSDRGGAVRQGGAAARRAHGVAGQCHRIHLRCGGWNHVSRIQHWLFAGASDRGRGDADWPLELRIDKLHLAADACSRIGSQYRLLPLSDAAQQHHDPALRSPVHA